MTAPETDWAKRWQEIDGAHWVTEAARYDTMNSAFGEAMLDAADLRPGERVLDVGCGNGATTIEAARRVYPNGAAVGIDLSAPMLGLARQRAEATDADAAAAEFVQGDAQTYTFTGDEFDVVVSRFGVMFFDDPAAAFTNIGGALRPGGRLSFVAWQGIERSQWIMVVGMAAAPHVGIPEGIGPDAPGPAGLADPARTQRILEAAGFTDVSIEELVRPMRIGDDVDDAMAFIQSMPLIHEMLFAASPDNRTAAVDAARAALGPYAGRDGVVMNDNAAWLVTAQH